VLTKEIHAKSDTLLVALWLTLFTIGCYRSIRVNILQLFWQH